MECAVYFNVVSEDISSVYKSRGGSRGEQGRLSSRYATFELLSSPDILGKKRLIPQNDRARLALCFKGTGFGIHGTEQGPIKRRVN